MKSKLWRVFRPAIAVQGLLLGAALLTWEPASAQNFVRNPDFEEPLGPDNWTIVYVLGGPSDFFIKGRTRMAHKNMAAPGGDTWDGDTGGGTNFWNKLGLNFKAGNDGLMHAYAKQIVTGLTPLAQYAVSIWMTLYDIPTDKSLVYMETIGGAAGNITKKTPYVTTASKNNPAGWTRYTITNTASTGGQIEIRLHYDKNAYTSQKWRTMDALYDHVSVIPVGQTNYLPPYKVLSFARTNQDITLKWQTAMNNKYRIQCSTNILNPLAWSWVRRSPSLDTNFAATSTNFTFKTNLTSLFSYDPSFNPDKPLFFRIHSTSWTP